MADRKRTKKHPTPAKEDPEDYKGTMPCGYRLKLFDSHTDHTKSCQKCQRINEKRAASSDPEPKQLSLFPELAKRMRALPNTIARSALFKVADKRQPRGYIDRKKPQSVAALKGIEVKYSGPELRQDDEDVMLEVYRICREACHGEGVPFVARRILTALKWNDDGKSYERLKLILGYLSDGNLTVETAREGFSGKLIRKFKWRDKKKHDPSSREYCVWLEPEIDRLLANYTAIDFEQRLSLHSSLAKAVHAHLSTHDDPYPYSVELWRTLTGSSIKTLYHFRTELKKALAELVTVEFLQAWNISEDDLVHVVRVDPRQIKLAPNS